MHLISLSCLALLTPMVTRYVLMESMVVTLNYFCTKQRFNSCSKHADNKAFSSTTGEVALENLMVVYIQRMAQYTRARYHILSKLMDPSLKILMTNSRFVS